MSLVEYLKKANILHLRFVKKQPYWIAAVKKILIIVLFIIIISLTMLAWWFYHTKQTKSDLPSSLNKPSETIGNINNDIPTQDTAPLKPKTFFDKLSDAAIERTLHQVRYDPKYVRIKYPMGDVPANMGVCTDVVIRSYRKLGIDLQQLVHEDISKHFNLYPAKKIWGSVKPDSNIDHRRVYNLQTFFKRHGETLPITDNPKDYKVGDIVTWQITPKFPHIGIVVNVGTDNPNRLMISHNIGEGPKLDDILFAFPITGHYRYQPK